MPGKEISRREFLRGLGAAGLGALCSGVLLGDLSCAGLQEAAADSPAGLEPPNSPHAREALFYTSFDDAGLNCRTCHELEPSRVAFCHTRHGRNYVKCQLCPKGCVISEGERGNCRVRENRGGKLYTMVYGNACSVNVDPIEKKPFYHFLPGSAAFSIATAGCNLHCLYCQNWQISQFPPEETDNVDLPPQAVVSYALRYGSRSIAYTYSEPTIFYEYMLDTARLARQQGLRNVVISAGYINHQPLRQLCQAVDAIKIDLKGYNPGFYQRVCDATLQPVLDTITTIRASGIHLEIVNLVVPTLNDDEEELRALCRWVVREVGPDVPLHFSRFYPQYKLTHLPPTPVESLERARQAALEAGVKYAYIGNVPGHPGNHTYCPRCGEIVIGRLGFAVQEYHIVDNACEFCGEPIAGVWQ
ncbi:MAG: AmmeMemoRadiSam system radical SAM enzyme [Anaerolineae bacterium]|nr:AmmeMemoRadiSam system radical SAM enzyme [Anaerolineae bacterium]